MFGGIADSALGADRPPRPEPSIWRVEPIEAGTGLAAQMDRSGASLHLGYDDRCPGGRRPPLSGGARARSSQSGTPSTKEGQAIQMSCTAAPATARFSLRKECPT